MDCNHARLLLIFSRDPLELDIQEAEALQNHLQQCPDCAHGSQAERSFDQAMSQVMRQVAVPEELRAGILARLERNRQVSRRRRVPLLGAAAAVLLLALGMGWYFGVGTRPEVDLDIFALELSEKLGASPEKVEDWFLERGLTIEAPRQLNYRLLHSFDVATFLDRRVPKLVFFHRGDGAIAEVYVLSENQFNLDGDLPQRFPASNHTIQRLASPSGYLYLVVLTGGGLEPFLKLSAT